MKGQEASDLLQELANAGNTRASIRELLHCIMVAMGGAPGLARELMLDLEGCEPGTLNHIKISLAIVELLKSSAAEETDEFEDEETLEALAQQLVRGNGEPTE